jgi:two-component system, cell cycle sensor histidine kinase and response regulator CckA
MAPHDSDPAEQFTRLEKAAQGSNAWIASVFRAFHDQSPHPGGITDLEGTVLHVNRAACDLVGVDPSAVIGQPIWDTPWWGHSNVERDTLRERILQAAQGQLVRFDTTSRSVTGELRNFDFSVRPLGDDAGRILCLVVDALDVTEKKRAEEQRLASASILRSVFRATPIGVTFNIGRDLVSVNDSMCAMMGYEEKELLGKSARMFYATDEEFETAGRGLYPQVEANGFASVETRFVRKDGSAIDVVLSAAMLRAEDPSAGFVVTVQDVTERKKAENALRDSENRFRALMEQAPFSIQVLSPQGTTVAVNKAFEELWGVNLEGLKDYNILTDKEIQALGFMPLVHKALQGERVVTPEVEFDVSVALGAGRRVRVQGIFYPLREPSGALRNIVLVHFDVSARFQAESDQRKLQEQLQQAMKMEAIGRLAGGIAHDFNNLLTTIGGNVELIHMSGDVPAKLVPYLDEIEKAAASAASLTRQLLAFSRRQIIEPRVVGLNDMVSNLHLMLTRLIGEDVELKAELAPHLGAVKVDPGQFEQVLMNLAVNARDAMPDGGKLLIETANVELDALYCARHPAAQPGSYVMLAVSDTGRGMNEEVKRRVFEPFFTTKPKGKGTGLGLATAFGIVQQADGLIEIYSEEGVGTSFKIYLPRIDERPESLVSAKKKAGVPGGSETILLVEDETSVANMARRMLQGLGYRVIQASGPQDAIRIAQQHTEPIHLLLTDVVMPDMNGKELAQELQRILPGLKVVFASGYTENVIVHHGVLEENLAFIGKPYTLSALSQKVREVLAQERGT